MDTILLAAAIGILLFLLLALFSRGGTPETVASPGLPEEAAGLARLSLAELASVAARLFHELGFQVAVPIEQPGRIDLRVDDPTPVTGQRAYVRCLLAPEGTAVESAEVQAALDHARGEQLSKAVVITTGVFSNEARLLATDAALELIDGVVLADLLRRHLPDVANRLGLPR